VWSETTIFNTGGVLALRDGDIFTVQPVRHDSAQLEGLRYAQDIARGDYNPDLPFFDILETRKLDLKHLVDPIPASIYYNARSAECWGKQSHCGTLTDGRFRPQLSLRGAVWSSLNSWDGGYYCSYPLLLDPPIRLEPISESKIQIIHPVISATPAGEYGTPYDEGVSWLSNPSPQLLPGQDYHAQSRPPLSLPTPLPTPSRRPFEGPRGGNLQPIKPFAEEGAIADEGRDKGNTGYHKSPVAEDESSKNDKGSFEKGGKKGEKMGDKKVDKKGDDKSDKKTDRKGDKKGGEKDEKKDHREDWNKGDTKDDAYGNEDGDQKNDSQKDRAASGEDDMVEAKTSRPQKSPDRSSTRSKSTAASLRGGLSQYVPVVATAVCGFLVAFVVS
jgi:hypothetical protein